MELMSLDEIIKKKSPRGAASKITLKPQKQLHKNSENKKSVKKLAFKETERISDARNKIIAKKRAKIIDARDKLAELTREKGELRHRLIENRRQRGGIAGNTNGQYKSMKYQTKPFNNGQFHKRQFSNGQPKVFPVQRKIFYDGEGRSNGIPIRRVNSAPQAEQMHGLVEIPRGYVDYDNMEQMEQEEYASAKRLTRTVINDTNRSYGRSFSPPTRPPYITMDGLNEPRIVSWGNSKGCFDAHKVPDVMEISHGNLPTQQHQPEPYRSGMKYGSHLSYKMRSRLEHAPDPHASMGIFSNPIKVAQQTPVLGRIVVSNLNVSVGDSDIIELFEDVGDLYTARIVRPGVAEVIYKSLDDAKKAVSTYHNRQLDGQPMKCLLVNPRATNKPTAPAMNSRHDTDDKESLGIDIDVLHKVLFRRN